MRDRIGCNYPCEHGSYPVYGYPVCVCTADGSTELAVRVDAAGSDEGAEADSVGTLDGAVVETGVRLGMRGSVGELGLAVGLGTFVADGADEAGGVVGALLAGVGRAGPWGS